MRKPLFASAHFALAAGIGILAFWAPAQTPARPQIFVPYVDTQQHPIAIDGQSGDWTARSLAHPINFYRGDGHAATGQAYGTTILGTMSDRADGEVTLYLTHDGQCLYLLAAIQDDALERRTAENNQNEAWKEDCLHIYIDSANAARASIPDPPLGNQAGYEQFGVSTDLNCYTEGCDFTTNNGNGSAGAGAQPDQQNWRVAVQIAGGGPYTYTFEERMPLSEVPGHNLRTMTPGNSYGFNAEFCDSDAGNYLQGWMFWSSDGAQDCYTSENLWGLMTLEPIVAAARRTRWTLFE